MTFNHTESYPDDVPYWACDRCCKLGGAWDYENPRAYVECMNCGFERPYLDGDGRPSRFWMRPGYLLVVDI
jgi:hypothetical protein